MSQRTVSPIREFSLTIPDDWHLHLRDGAAMAAVLGDTARRFARAIVMPNLRPPVTTVAAAAAYRERILAALPRGAQFEPLMTLYLTDNTAPAEIRAAHASGIVRAVKYYPAGATTNSDSGVTDLKKCAAVFDAMQERAIPLLVHGEVTDPEVDVFDREKAFIERHLAKLVADYPGLRIVFEHITTSDAVGFVLEAPENVAATITAHHLLLNRNAIFSGGLRPHHFCLPVLKRESDRAALVGAVASGNAKFFLGTDSAPHSRRSKEAACCSAGIYTAHAAIELYAEAFEAAGRLDRLEGFASFFGADFYRLPRNSRRLTLVREPWHVAGELPFAENETLVPMRAGETVSWRVAR